MTSQDPGSSATTSAAGRIPPVLWVVAAVVVAGVVALVMTGGGLGYRSVAEWSDKVPIGHGIDTVRVEIQNGRVDVDVSEEGAEGVIAYAGGVRRAANGAEELARLEQVPFRLVAEVDAKRAQTLVLRGPQLGRETSGVLALELGIRVRADLNLEIAVKENGHVIVARRTGRTSVDTGRGDLRFEHCRGAVRGKTGRGNVIAFDHRGDLRLDTTVGDMQAFLEQPGTELQLTSGEGTVQCGVPADCEFVIDARAEVGRIGSDFGLKAEQNGFAAALTGTRGSGRTKVVLRTGKGHLSFRAR